MRGSTVNSKRVAIRTARNSRSLSSEKRSSGSPIARSVADSGDLRANALVSLAVEELVLHVRALARQLFADERAALPVALSGGLLNRGSTFRKRLEHRLKSAVPGAAIRAEPVVAARGAVRAALRILGEAMV